MKRAMVAIILAMACVCEARIITVDNDAPADFNNIQAAIHYSNDGDIVVVADGVYTGQGNGDIDFHGKAITVKSRNGPGNCIIDCINSDHGFEFHGGEDANSIVDGFTITSTTGGAQGVWCDEFCSPTITRCIIIRMGRGIGIENSTSKISNCVIADNRGGGIVVWESTPTIINCTVVDNGWPTGIQCWWHSHATITNCIVRGNDYDQIDAGGSNVAIVKYCNVEGGPVGEGNIDTDPCFASADYCRLLPGSPCIDAGINGPAPSPPDTDVQRYPRLADGDNDGEAVVDMGAYEAWAGDAPIMWLSDVELDFATDEGGPNPPQQTVVVHSTGTGTVNWEVDEDSPWLQAHPNAGSSTGHGEVVLSVDVNGLPKGEYSCVVVIRDADVVNRPRRLVVNLHVGLPLIGVSPGTVRFVYPVDRPKPGPQTLSIWNDDEGVLDWAITEDCNWLEVEPYSGRSTGQMNEVILRADTSGLGPGRYHCLLAISADRAPNSPYTVPVSLYVGEVLYVPGEYGSIQAAIDDSNHADTVIVADGTYTGEGNRDIEFKGKAIRVRSQNGPSNCIIDCNGSQWDEHRGFDFVESEGPDTMLEGFTITNVFSRMYCPTRPPFICSPRAGAIHCGMPGKPVSPTIVKCIMTGDLAPDGCGLSVGHYGSHPTLINCTISGFGGPGIFADYADRATLKNCIVWGNGNEITMSDDKLTASYSNIEGGWEGEGNIDVDPCFADADGGDFHLKSQAGGWDPNEERWTTDETTSPCIDAGDPMTSVRFEPFPNGGIVNMGAYGGTAQASKSYFGNPPCQTVMAGDVNGDCEINFEDFRLMALHWFEEH